MKLTSKIIFLSLLLTIIGVIFSCGGEKVPPVSKLTAPSNLTANPLDGKVELSWGNIVGVKFKVYYGLASGQRDGKGATEGDSPVIVNQNSLTLSNLTNGTTYFFQVTSYDADENIESDFSNAVSATPKVEKTAKEITAFSFPVGTGIISGTAIAVTVPFGTDRSALTPTIVHTGVSVSPASGIAQNFTSPVTYIVTAADASTKSYIVTVTVVASNTAKEITSFNILGRAGSIGANTIAVTVPFGTNVTALVPTIAITGASVSPASGVAQNFTSPVTYTVTAADNSTNNYTVKVTVASNTAKEITSFTIVGQVGNSTIGTDTITLTVPFGTDRSALIPTIAITGASVSPASGVVHDFTGDATSRTYIVTAANATTKSYIVTVAVENNNQTVISLSKIDITLSCLQGGLITAQLIISSSGGSGAPLSWTSSLSSSTPPWLSISPNDGTTPTDITVTANCAGLDVRPYFGSISFYASGASNSPRIIQVNVMVEPLAIGDSYQGGKVAYILQPGDPGYSASEQRGLIAAIADQSTGIRWYNGSFTTTGATATALGTGHANTDTVVASQEAGSYAAKLCDDIVLGGYNDWYLPSEDELNKLYLNKNAIGGFATADYWSSSEASANNSWFENFINGYRFYFPKQDTFNVRCVRSF